MKKILYKIKQSNKYVIVIVSTIIGILLLGFIPANKQNLEYTAKFYGNTNDQLILPFIRPNYEKGLITGEITDHLTELQSYKSENTINFVSKIDDIFIENNYSTSELIENICVYITPKKAKLTFQPRLSMYERSKKYSSLVQTYAQTYNLPSNLILAIMQIESGFNPNIISNRDAHGLMQIVPNSAGKDVHSYFGKKGVPTKENLLDPSTNIKYGTAYISMLNKYYFSEITNLTVREYCIIASYNYGPNAFLATFSKDKSKAIEIINSYSPNDFYIFLQTQLRVPETRAFVKNVVNAKQTYIN